MPFDQDARDSGIALALSGVAGLVMAVYCLSLPKTPPQPNKSGAFAPGAVFRLMRARSFLILVVISLGVAVVHKFYFHWNSLFLKAMLRSSGVEGVWEGRISSIGQIAEVAVMAGLGLMILRLGFKWTLVCGAVAYLLRCLIFAEAACLDGPVSIMSLACGGQSLHGVCFACFLATAFIYVDRVAPKDIRGSAQIFYGTCVIGFGMFVGAFISGGVGSLFTTEAGQETLRDRWGIASAVGMKPFETTAGEWMMRDWPGIWLAGGAIAAGCLVALIVLFPKQTPDEEQEPRAPTNDSATEETT